MIDSGGDARNRFPLKSYLLMLTLGVLILGGLVAVERVESLRFPTNGPAGEI
jgi:hypothetical protein